MTDSTPLLRIGLDVGGTKTQAVYRFSAANEDKLRILNTHGSNLQSMGASRVAGLITRVITEIRQQSGGGGALVAVAGVAGAGRDEDHSEVEVLLQQALESDDQIQVYSDAAVALEGAFSGQSGVIIISGTGSGAYALTKAGALRRAGGWGPTLGDPGSGRAIGLGALRVVARALDGGRKTELTSLVEKQLGLTSRADLIRAVYRDGLDPASCARFVLESAEQGDAVALDLVHTEIESLAEESALVMDDTLEPRYVLMGGLSENAWFQNQLQHAIASRKPAWIRVEPDESPAMGALSMTHRLVP